MFESAGMLISFILLGKFLEARAKRHTCSVLASLMTMAPETACLIGRDEKGTVISEQMVDSRLIQVGDELKVRPGGKVPADGEVVEVSRALLSIW
jgi:P-type Cu+ transporter